MIREKEKGFFSAVLCGTPRLCGERNDAGFTLIELIAVVLIIAIIATAVAPNLDRVSPKYSVRAGAREIASTAESCRSQSVLTGETYSVVYDLDEQEYWILLPQKYDPETGEPEDTEREPLLPKRYLPRGVKLVGILTADNEEHSSDQVQLDFSPFGNTGSHIVLLRYGDEDKEGLKIWVRVNALLGFSTFHYKETEFAEYEAEEDDELYGEKKEEQK